MKLKTVENAVLEGDSKNTIGAPEGLKNEKAGPKAGSEDQLHKACVAST